MRPLFFIVLIISIILGFLNGVFIPGRQEHAKELMDSHVKELPLGNVNDMRYKGVISLKPLSCRIENLDCAAENGKWDGVVYKNISVKVDRINFDPVYLLWNEQRKLVSTGNVELHGETTFEEIGNRLGWVNTDLKEVSMRFDGGHVYVNGYFEPLKNKFEFDGDLVISPTGDLKYRLKKATNADGEVVHSRQVMNLIEEKTNFVLTIKAFNRAIKLDELDVDESGIKLTGKT